ncbi:DUF1214 domain-containing protein [Oryzibacter oryziterrae]|uniref:DUF1214 domain-containing protein n=1 Tax=Oryzibacter oryziterrae TaxID=2766474 RepID=UPI001F2B1268|nr:DUF1214 domain-containing protein [Oryzibacter oryziterrae]
MLSTLRFIIVVIAGSLLGLASAWWVLNDPRLDISPRLGVWSVAGSEANPYAAARLARSTAGRLTPSQGIALIAERDGDGARLNPACTYLIEGPMPVDAVWTLTIGNERGRLTVNPAGRVAFTSADSFRYDPGNRVQIGVGPEMGTGDFIVTGGLDSLRVTLRLYSPTFASHPPDPAELPTITRRTCPAGAPA